MAAAMRRMTTGRPARCASLARNTNPFRISRAASVSAMSGDLSLENGVRFGILQDGTEDPGLGAHPGQHLGREREQTRDALVAAEHPRLAEELDRPAVRAEDRAPDQRRHDADDLPHP